MSKFCECCGQKILTDCYDWDFDKNTLVDGDAVVKLRAQHAEIFEILHQKTGRVISKPNIHKKLYGLRADGGADIKTIEVQICRLRKKLIGTRFEIHTHHARGYALEIKEDVVQ